MKRVQYILLSLLAFITQSCVGSMEPAFTVMRFLPGECLNSYELSYYTPQGQSYQTQTDRGGKDYFIFGFALDLKSHEEVQDPEDPRRGVPWLDMPTNVLYNHFGKNKYAVKQAYESAFADMRNYWAEEVGAGRTGFDFTTVLYSGGVSLTAESSFGGHPAGEELAPYLTYRPSSMGWESEYETIVAPRQYGKEVMGKSLDLPLDYVCLLGSKIGFSIPVGDCTLTNENVTFHLSIPVKNVKYLTWLNNQISNPDAPVPYEDGVLTCTFTTRYGLE